MAQFTLDVPNDKVPRIKAALLGLFDSHLPVEAIADPEADPPIPGWTDSKKIQWLIRHWLILQVRRWEQKEARDVYVSTIAEDETLIDPVV